MKEIITTDGAPCAIGPYSQAVRVGNMLFASGQVPLDPISGKVVEGDATVQATQCCKNVAAILKAANLSMDNVVKTTVFLAEMAHFPLVNEVYKQYFTEPYPARSCVAVKDLPLGVLVEIEVIAMQA